MRYSVIAPDGQKYGPADLALLNQWLAEGRLNANSELEEEGTGVRLAASQVSGLVLPPAQTPQAQPTAPVQPTTYAAPEQPKPFQVPTQPQQAPPNWQQAPSYSNYPRQNMSSGAGQGELTAAWVLGAVTFAFCCPVLPVIGLVMANKSLSLGNQSAQSARTFNIVVLSLSLIVYVAYFLFFVLAIASAGTKGFR